MFYTLLNFTLSYPFHESYSLQLQRTLTADTQPRANLRLRTDFKKEIKKKCNCEEGNLELLNCSFKLPQNDPVRKIYMEVTQYYVVCCFIFCGGDFSAGESPEILKFQLPSITTSSYREFISFFSYSFFF